MKNTIAVISVVSIVLISLMLGSYFDRLYQQEKIVETTIRVFPMDKNFIEPNEVAQLIALKDSMQQQINIAQIEAVLEQNDFIDNAEVYRDLNGHLIAEVEQYKPIARVWGKNSFYLDKNGHKKPLSKHYTERLMLVFGDLLPEKQPQTVALIQNIYNDSVLNKIVSEIHLRSRQTAVLKLIDVSGDFIIEINPDKTQEQLFKLKTMYAYVHQKHWNNKYKTYDFRFNNQVVCKK